MDEEDELSETEGSPEKTEESCAPREEDELGTLAKSLSLTMTLPKVCLRPVTVSLYSVVVLSGRGKGGWGRRCVWFSDPHSRWWPSRGGTQLEKPRSSTLGRSVSDSGLGHQRPFPRPYKATEDGERFRLPSRTEMIRRIQGSKPAPEVRQTAVLGPRKRRSRQHPHPGSTPLPFLCEKASHEPTTFCPGKWWARTVKVPGLRTTKDAHYDRTLPHFSFAK